MPNPAHPQSWPPGEAAPADRVLAIEEARYRALFEALDEGFCVIERVDVAPGDPLDFRYVEANAAFEAQSGVTGVVGRTIREVVPQESESWCQTYDAVAMTGEPVRFARELATTGRTLELHAFPLGDTAPYHVAVAFRDISERQRVITALRESEEALRQSEEHLRALLEATAYAIYRMSPNWDEMRQLDGRGFIADTEHPRIDWLETYIEPEDRPGVLAAIATAVRTRGMFELEHPVRRVDGSVGWTLSRAIPILDANGDIREWLGAASDITERKRAELALRASEERQALLLEFSDALRPLADPAEIQETATRLLGEHLQADRTYYCRVEHSLGSVFVDRDHVRGDVSSLVGRYDFAVYATVMARIQDGRTWVVPDVRVDAELSQPERERLEAQGVVAWVDVPLIKHDRLVAILCVTQREARRWSAAEVGLIEDAAERIWSTIERTRAEDALRESEQSLQRRVSVATAELRSLSRRLLSVQEEERRILARELHDEIGQVLTGLGLQLGAEGGVPPARLVEARRIVRELTDQVRQLSMDLRPAALDRYGLLPALEWHSERYRARTGVAIDFRHEGIDRRFPPEIEIAAYRVVQEALTNIARHAGSPEASVRMLADADRLIVVVRDGGRGFAADTMTMSSGIGGMRERVELLGGTLSVDSAPGEGTVIAAELPLDVVDDPGKEA